MALAAVCSKEVILLLFIYCLLLLSFRAVVCVGSLFCCGVLCVLSSLTIKLAWKRKLIALLVAVFCVSSSWVNLWSVIVAFPAHTDLILD